MLRTLNISLFLIFLISSISTGFTASPENFSVSVEEIIPVSQIVTPYFDSLVESSKINVNEEPSFYGSWSPDGSRLVIDAFFNPMTGTRLYAVYVLNADGSGIRELASTPNNTKERSLSIRGVYYPFSWSQWSPDGSRIGIFANIFTVRDFYVIADPDNTLIKTAGKCNYTTVDNIRENILDLEWQTNFIWNPEDTKALIIMDKDPLNYQLYLLDSNGHVLQQFTDTYNVITALWSNDGKKIAYSTGHTEDEETGLWIINENGTENKRLVNGIVIDWSPDDSRVFYVDENFSLYSIKVDGTDRFKLSTEHFYRSGDVFSFSPDRKNLIFNIVKSGKVTIFLANSTGKNVQVLEEFSGRCVFKPSWSPKGDKIAFTQGTDLYTINPDGSEKNLIASAITDYEWHPSGDFISFTTSDSVFVANPDGSTKIQLTGDDNNYRFLNKKYLSGWSPDGSRLLISNGSTDLSIIKLKGYEDPLSIDFLTPIEGENCELRVRCMSEPVENVLINLNENEIGFTNSSGFLNYSCPATGRYVINASKAGYRSANKVLFMEANSSTSPEKSVASESSSDLSSDFGKEEDSRPEFQVPGFKGITLTLFLLFFTLRRNLL
ncbi:translocation protein TolB [Methanosarcina siciliae HI350]|uniref:Translocation protein TolB n=1 Tax=Methanosarcina siciliae HI350 TaxID=1434119 RepID=A0A0E3PFD3_9EURY|nr:TolB family protein [Methanosarcina siciliae]AKB32578.1 translocation protein TolB [Methanosarcina siciliae HI350]